MLVLSLLLLVSAGVLGLHLHRQRWITTRAFVFRKLRSALNAGDSPERVSALLDTYSDVLTRSQLESLRREILFLD